ncbi:MAG: epoxide hydrolase N-terminal domain-containing protein [Novosphingobium sp.]|nr:epoxide hydrolase N-terminal domain-containing protein [Novosphingobium sp.]
MQSFEVCVEEEALVDLERRLRATRWLQGWQTGDEDCGVATDFVRRHCDWWLKHFDWRALEARINRQPNFLVEIDGLRLHCIDRRSPRADAVPLVLINGWPTSFLAFLGVCDALAEPEGEAPAFHVIIPLLPGYATGFPRAGLEHRRAGSQLCLPG